MNNDCNDDSETPKLVAMQDPIQKAIGSFGRWHLLLLICVSVSRFPLSWNMMSIIFVGPPPTFKCINETIDACTSSCPGYEYDRSVFSETIITQWDLVCENAQLANISQMIFMFGIMVGNLGFGVMADKIGRRIPMLLVVLLLMFSSIATAFAPWYWLYCALRFITGIASGGQLTISFVLMMEIIGIKWRDVTSILFHLPFNLGHLTLPIFAYFIRDWHYLMLAISLPTILLISYVWLIPESPRWLLAVGRVQESADVLEKAARINKRPTDNILADLVASKENIPVPKSNGNILDLLRTPNMRLNTLVMWFNWCVIGLCFYGMAQYAGQIGGDIFLNVGLSAVLEVPTLLVCIYAVRRFGRKKTIVFGNCFAGIGILIISLVPPDSTVIILICASCGIIGSNLAFPAIYLYTGEIFPTVVRNIGMGTTSMAARAGTMVAPFIASLSQTSHVLSPIIFGAAMIIGAVLMLFLPDTHGILLPETLEDGENFGKKRVKAKE